MIKKICFFSACFATHKQVRMEYAEKYFPKDIKLFLLTPKKENKYRLNRTEVIELSKNKILFTLKMRNFCRKNNIDLLINLGSHKESFSMLVATFLTGTKFIINLATNIWNAPSLEEKRYKKDLYYIIRFFLIFPFIFAKKIILPSQDLTDITKKYFFFIKSKIHQLPLIIDERLFPIQKKSFVRKKLKLPLNKEIILYTGRIQYLKGSDLLFKIIEKNKKRLFILIGERDKELSNQKFDNVIFIPSAKLKELVNYYNAADLFIFPSRVEAYGMVHREAMLCKTPALVSDIPSLRLTPYVLKAKLSLLDMQNKIDNFFSMPKKKKLELGELSRKAVLEESSFEKLKGKYKEIYLE